MGRKRERSEDLETYLYRLTKNKKDINKWMNNQQTIADSITKLILDHIQVHGYTDPTHVVLDANAPQNHVVSDKNKQESPLQTEENEDTMEETHENKDSNTDDSSDDSFWGQVNADSL